VYLSDPQPYVPESTSDKGRKPTRLQTDVEPIEVQHYCKGLANKEFKEVKLRKGTKGWIKARVHIARVWVWDGQEQKARERTLIIRKGIKKRDEIKYALSNFTLEERTAQQFAFMQGQRFWIERAFEDMKGELGMADYQVRKFNAWYHHQVLVMQALEFINRKRIQYQEKIPLLSVRDIRLQIIEICMNSGVKMEKEIEQMLRRHQQRMEDINRYYPDNQYF
jgi:hypothetical protein